MKSRLYLLMFTILVVVMSELQVTGMMPEIAADLGVSTGQVGLLVSMYALGMAIGGPLLAFVARRSPPKRSLLTVVAVYGILEVLVPLVHEYWWVALLRILTGSLSGAAFGISVTLAARLAVAGQDVDDDAAARAKDVQCRGSVGRVKSMACPESDTQGAFGHTVSPQTS